ncbi:hypothetical protein ARMSODRAFT_1022184 [Armillaria solidipes]|uniref:Uncharacterized protein n=1 Tax=Armillaria solidipes TaxID=1076256 RepID=A0A2H3BA49_9AGAR|nr:hypothetical protein ARMSODRAFT_1022184 [Armillaria solidipes]
MSAKDTGADNPWTVILHCLTGIGLSKPHKPQAFTLWFKVNAKEVKEAWQAKMDTLKEANKPMPTSKHAAAFQSFKSTMYCELANKEKLAWEELAVEEHEAAMKEYEEKLNTSISKDPKDLQDCLKHLPGILKLLIDIVGEVMGCLVSVYVAGPQLADGGWSHITLFHGSKTVGSIKQTSVEAEQVNFKKFILLIYENFIKKCFTVEMCCAQVLPANMPTLESIGFVSEINEITLHAIKRELYNATGDSEFVATATMAVVTKGSSKIKQVLREPPVKKTTGIPKEKTGLNGMPNRTATEKAPAPDQGEPMNELTIQAEQKIGPTRQQLDSSIAGAPDLLTVSPKTPPLTVSQWSSPYLPASHIPPPRDLETGLLNISRPPSPAVSRANSVVPKVIINLLFGKKRDPNEAEKDKEPERYKEKRFCKELGGDDVDAGKKRGPEEADEDNKPPCRKEKRSCKGLGGDDAGSGDTSLKERDKQSQLGMRNTGAPRTKAGDQITSDAPNLPISPELLKLELPPDAPKWAVNAIKLFQREEVSVSFLQLVEKWITFEVKEDSWDDGGRLSAMDCPRPITDWIN